MSEFLTYRKYQSGAEAQDVAQLLEAAQIEWRIETDVRTLDDNFFGQNYDSMVRLMIRASSFTAATEVLVKSYADVTPAEDYYLLSFSKEELREVVEKRDEWGDYDYALAIRLLRENDPSFTPSTVQALAYRRMSVLKTPQRGDALWTAAGYLSALMGGIGGIAIGIYLFSAKKTLPNGERVFVYNEVSRNNGYVIAGLGLVMIVAWRYLLMLEVSPGLAFMDWALSFLQL